MLTALKLKNNSSLDFDALIRFVGEALQKVPKGDGKNTLVQANSIFVDGSLSVLSSFSEALKAHFKSGAQEVCLGTHYRLVFVKVDFIHATEEARNTINAWIAANTANKIEELFKPGSLSESTRLVLANAMYFKGKWNPCLLKPPIQGTWKEPFDKRATYAGDFHTLCGDVIKCQKMYNDSIYPHSNIIELDAEAIKVPFQM